MEIIIAVIIGYLFNTLTRSEMFNSAGNCWTYEASTFEKSVCRGFLILFALVFILLSIN